MRGDGPLLTDSTTDRVRVNPTCVGMDRMIWRRTRSPCCKPHVRGNGPYNEVTISMANVVNPTHVKSGHVYPSSGN